MGKSVGLDAGSKMNVIQKMPNEQIRHQLISISRALYSCMEIINEKANKERYEKLKLEIAKTYHHDELVQRKEILKRREIIERYKEDKEKKYQEKVREMEMVSKTKQAERDEEDKNRREADLKRRLLEAAVEREKEEHRFAMKMAIDKLRESEIGRKIIEVIGEEELYKYDPNSINSLHIDAVIKHSREQKEKLKVQYKKVDFVIRAMHEAEVPLIQKQAEEEMRTRREIQITERQRAIEKRDRLIRMANDKNDFLQSVVGKRHEEYVQQMAEFNQRLNVAREQRLAELRQEYIEKKKEDFRKEKKLRKVRKEQEKQRQIEAEKKRKDDERLAQIRLVEAERTKKLDEQARKQREREEEIERRLIAEKESSTPNTASAGSSRRGGPSGTTHQQDKGRGDNTLWRPKNRENEENQPSQVDSRDKWRTRGDDQRQRTGTDRRPDDSSDKKTPSNESWRPRQRPDQQNRDDRRDDRHDDSSDKKTPSNESWRPRQRPDQQSRDDRRDDRRDDSSDKKTPSNESWRPRPRPDQQSRDDRRDDRRDDSSDKKTPSHESWRPRPRPDQQSRDDRRVDRRDDRRDDWRDDRRDVHRDDRRDERRGYSSQQTQPTASSASERRNERTSDAEIWQTVEKKRPNQSRTGTDRPSQQRSEEFSSGGSWRNRPRGEPRDTGRTDPDSSSNQGRSNQSGNWRTREFTRLNSWRANDDEDNDSENNRPSASTGPSNDDRRNDNRRMGGTSGDDRRGQNRNYGSGN